MFGDLARVNSNSQAFSALTQLNRTNGELGQRQMRLSTGKRINAAEDDSAGYAIARKLEAKTRGQAQALANIGDAKSLMTVAEGSLTSTMDILQTMKEKAVQAANDTLGAAERTKIKNQLDALVSEIDDTLSGAEFNGKALFSDDVAGTSFDFQVGAESGDVFATAIDRMSTAALGLAGEVGTPPSTADFTNFRGISGLMAGGGDFVYDLSGSSSTGNYTLEGVDGTAGGVGDVVFNLKDGGTTLASTTITFGGGNPSGAQLSYKGLTFDFTTVTDSSGNETPSILSDFDFSGAATISATDGGGLDVSDNASANIAIGKIDAAISTLSDNLAGIGDDQKRLTFKQDNLNTSMNNYESARSRIEDADFAKEQMNIVKAQILQQTGTASLAQANSAPQSILSLIG